MDIIEGILVVNIFELIILFAILIILAVRTDMECRK